MSLCDHVDSDTCAVIIVPQIPPAKKARITKVQHETEEFNSPGLIQAKNQSTLYMTPFLQGNLMKFLICSAPDSNSPWCWPVVHKGTHIVNTSLKINEHINYNTEQRNWSI